MAHQAQVNETNGRIVASRAVVENLGEFAHDVVTLAELQAKLLAADLQDLRAGAAIPVALLALAACVALGCFPVLLMGVAWLLVDYQILTRGWAFLVATGTGVALAAVLGAIGWYSLRRQLATLRRSQEELERNITWIKSVLKHSGHTTRDPKTGLPRKT